MIRMIALDLDGTLLTDDNRVSEANRDAIARAESRGVLISPCTGRSWPESRMIIGNLPGHTIGVFVNGSIVVDMPQDRRLHAACLPPALAHELVETLADEPESVLVFRDAEGAGHDYLVTGRGQLTANTQWWFDLNKLRVHHQPIMRVHEMEHVLRVGMVAACSRMPSLMAKLSSRFNDRVTMHSFGAVEMPNDESMHILEAFAINVNKWTGLQWIAQSHGIAEHEIAVVGDQVNDMAMFESGACKIAMGNAVDAIRSRADYITRSNNDDGVAHAINQILDEQWHASGNAAAH